MTESVGPLTATSRTDFAGEADAADVLRTVGRPVATAEVAVLGEDGVVATGSPAAEGELVARADTLFSGYHGRPEETARAFAGDWYRTGDAGWIDPAGYVYITGRVDDLINSGGMKVHPSEIEAALAGMAGVAEAAAFGIPHARYGTTVALAVAPEPGADISPDDVLAVLSERLASYKRPTRVVVVDELPRNAAMKVQRFVLTRRYGDRAEGPQPGDADR
jgi:acyl-CoA synthetase (AMP-forming)/AMP-acid ligase II